MADVIRRAIIEIETRQKKSRLEAPGADAASQGFKAQAEAATKAEAAITKAEQAQKRLTETSQISAFTMVKNFREAGEGALRMTRGLALLSANGSDDLKKLVQSVALAQGAFDVFAGGFKVVTNLLPLLGGPATAAIGGVTGAILLGAAAWRKWEEAAEQAATRATEMMERSQKQFMEGIESTNAQSDLARRDREQRIGLAVTDDERVKRIREAITVESANARVAEGRIRGADAIPGVKGLAAGAAEARKGENAIRARIELERDLFEVEKRRDAERQRALNDTLRGIGKLPGFGAISVPEQSAQFQSFAREVQATFDAMEKVMISFRSKALIRENLIEIHTNPK